MSGFWFVYLKTVKWGMGGGESSFEDLAVHHSTRCLAFLRYAKSHLHRACWILHVWAQCGNVCCGLMQEDPTPQEQCSQTHLSLGMDMDRQGSPAQTNHYRNSIRSTIKDQIFSFCHLDASCYIKNKAFIYIFNGAFFLLVCASMWKSFLNILWALKERKYLNRQYMYKKGYIYSWLNIKWIMLVD